MIQMLQNVEKQAKRITNEQVRAMFLQDINALSLAFTPENAVLALALFFAKWEAHNDPNVGQVSAYFKNQWTDNAMSNWTRGHCPGCVINNNGLEATNLVLKVEITQRVLMPVLNFFDELRRWLKNLSLRKDIANPNYIPFTTFHTISTKDWTEAYRWSKDSYRQIRRTGEEYVAVSKNVSSHLTYDRAARLAGQLGNLTFDSFDTYTTTSNSICLIRVDQSREEGYNCTCKQNAKEHSCIHSLGVSIIRGIMVPPLEARATLLGRKRRRGRKPHVAAVWMYQPFDINSPAHHPLQDPNILAGQIQMPDIVAVNVRDDIVNELV
jgi:hypothetical protein